MKTITTDVAIIGVGSAGMSAYRGVQAAGRRALTIEHGPYGTTCARVGCMPSKLLLAAAEAAWAVHEAPGFGVLAAPPRIDGVAVMQRVREERDRFVGFSVDTVDDWPEQDKLRGTARFTGPNTLVVDDHIKVDAQAVVIATGAKPKIPEMLQGLDDRLVVNDDVFDWTDLPRRVAVFGPGVIGLELGQALARLGVEVRIFGSRGSLGGLRDTVVRDHAEALFRETLALETRAEVRSVTRVGDAVEVVFRGASGDWQTESFDYVLAATGRAPALEGLDLAAAGVPCNDRGVPRFDRHTLQVADLPIFIAGDANAELPLLHEAADEGRIAGENAARYPDVQPGLRRAPLSIVFCDPQIIHVGEGPATLKDGSYVTGAIDFAGQGRSRIMRRNRGLLHVYVERTSGRFLGAEGLGPELEHIGHLLAWSVQQGLSVGQMLEMPFYHPVIEEGLRTALRDAQRQISRR